MTSNDIIDQLSKNKCLFYVELDKWLKEQNKKIPNSTELQSMYGDFMYFMMHKGIFKDTPVENISYWLFNACATTFQPGYDNSAWKYMNMRDVVGQNNCPDYDFY